MVTARETIYSTIFAALKGAVDGLNFVTVSRKFKLWSDVPPAEQPALFFNQIRENASMGSATAPGPPNMVVLNIDVVIYVFAGQGPEDTPAPLMNSAIDAIEKLFPPPPRKPETLVIPGVSSIRVFGDIEYREGTTGQGIAIVPLKVIAV